jgi:hypothetical protein
MPIPLDASPAPLPSAPFSLPHDPAAEIQMVHLAFEIANRAVVEDIESYAVKEITDGRIYWDTRPMTDLRLNPPTSVDMATQAIRYALTCGLAAVHPQRPYLITLAGRG